MLGNQATLPVLVGQSKSKEPRVCQPTPVSLPNDGFEGPMSEPER